MTKMQQVNAEDIKALLQNARQVARGIKPEVSKFHSTGVKITLPETQQKQTEYASTIFDDRKPEQDDSEKRTAATVQEQRPKTMTLPLLESSDVFGLRWAGIMDVLRANRMEILREFPKLEILYITLKVENHKFSVVEYDPPGLKKMFEERFQKALDELAGDVRGRNGNGPYVRKFDYMLPMDSRTLESPGTVGPTPESEPQRMDMGKHYLLPGEPGYVFESYESGPERKLAVYEIKLVSQDEFSYKFLARKMLNGIWSEKHFILPIEEPYVEDFEGIRISFSRFKDGSRSLRVDPYDATKETKQVEAPDRSDEKAAAVVGLGTAAGLLMLPQIAEWLGVGPVPESVTIEGYTISANIILAAAAASVLGAIGGQLNWPKLAEKFKKGDKK